MTPPSQMPEKTAPDASSNAGSVADAVEGNWVDRYAPVWSQPYLRLSRADRPAGTWLLLIPCLWSLLLAIFHSGQMSLYDLWIAVGCGIGSFLMRGAGCTWNDFTDRHIDAQVERTRSRPLPSAQATPKQALIWMGLQALIALGVLLTFNWTTILLGIAALAPVAIYPFAKRFTWWPQVFLGVAFNWGALVGWTAHTGSLHWAPILLYLCGIVWTLFYDTIYAHQDIEDDALIGVKSTARLFDQDTPRWLRRFLVVSVLLMCAAVLSAWTATGGTPFAILVGLLGPWAFGVHMVMLMTRLDINDPANCMRIFRACRNTGLIPLLFFAVALFV